jgi:hypothetical protein
MNLLGSEKNQATNKEQAMNHARRNASTLEIINDLG